MTCDSGCDWAELCAALRKKSVDCGCDCDRAEPCAALRKKNVDCGCDWAEPCAALRCAAQEKFELRLRLRLG